MFRHTHYEEGREEEVAVVVVEGYRRVHSLVYGYIYRLL